MVDVGIIEGSESSAKPVIFTGNTVYVHRDIKHIDRPINPDDPDSPVEEIWQYHEYKYSRDEYDALLGDTLVNNNDKIRELEEKIDNDNADTERVNELEIAITDLEITNYEMQDTIAEDEQSITDLEIAVAELQERQE